MKTVFENFNDAPDRWMEWSESAQRELDRIQTALNRIAESLEPSTELGHQLSQ